MNDLNWALWKRRPWSQGLDDNTLWKDAIQENVLRNWKKRGRSNVMWWTSWLELPNKHMCFCSQDQVSRVYYGIIEFLDGPEIPFSLIQSHPKPGTSIGTSVLCCTTLPLPLKKPDFCAGSWSGRKQSILSCQLALCIEASSSMVVWQQKAAGDFQALRWLKPMEGYFGLEIMQLTKTCQDDNWAYLEERIKTDPGIKVT